MKLNNKIESSESIQHQFKMSSSSATRPSGSATSYTFGIPGSQVTLNIGKSGERSLVLSRGPISNSKTSSSVTVPVGQRKFPDGWVGPADMPFCKVCYDAGLPVADYTDHYVKDQPGPTGKVVCPTLLAQKCLTCGLTGHTSSYCSQKFQRDADRAAREREEREKAKKANGGWETVGAANSKPKPRVEDVKPKSAAAPAPAAAAALPRKTYGGSFGVLCPNESSDDSEYEREQEEIRNTPAGVPKPVEKERPILTGPPPAVEPPKQLTWAQRAAAAALKPVSVASSSVPAPIKDARFQLHHLCANIEPSKRAPSRKAQQNAHAPSPAAAAADESSKKRKQDSAIVPA
jgi:hypothetical protein